MRKLILITALMLASASAFAGETRSLTLASSDVTAVSQPTVDRAAVRQVSIKLAQAAASPTTLSDAAPTLPQATTTTTTQAPAETAAPEATTQPATTTTADTKPAKRAKTTRRESYEHKARRFAARYGVYW
jgi:hypothetical protein